MITVKLKYFGQIAEKAGIDEEQLTLVSPNLNTLIKDLSQKYDLTKLNFSVAVNRAQVTTNVTLKNNDEVALLPPFAGG